MDVNVLGPVEVWRDGVPVVLARRQQRLILGILALEANHPISSDRLIDLLWGDDPAPRARAILQSRISELRALLGSGPQAALATRGSSYLLHIDPDRVDAHRFLNAVSTWRQAGSDERARAVLREALGLWRGPALGGEVSHSAGAALGKGLESARTTAQEDLFELELQLGDEAHTVDELLAASAANPTRERLLGQAMLALHRTGRGTEALQIYDHHRRWLREELGVDPTTQVEQIYLTVLNGDPDTAGSAGPAARFTAAVPGLLPPDLADFTGRGEELAFIRGAFAQSVVTGTAVVAVTGRGGIGKTTLCTHIAHQLADRFPDGQLYINLRGIADDEPTTPSEALARFLRALGVDGSAMPDTLEERTDLYRSLLFRRRVLVVLDNAASDEQVVPLIPSGLGPCVIVNGRARLGATFAAHTLSLDVLDTAEAIDLLARIAGKDRVAAEPNAAEELCQLCGHLPLALRIAGAKLRTKPHWRVAKLVSLLADERSRLDQFSHGHLDVRASISMSYAGLDRDAQRLLRRLGDMDAPETTVWLSTAILDVSPDRAEALLEQLFDAQLVDVAGQDPTGHSRYRLHDLVRLFAAERANLQESRTDMYEARTRIYGAWLFVTQAAHRAVYGGDYHNILGTAPRWPVELDLTRALVAQPSRWFEAERQGLIATVRSAATEGRAEACWELASTASRLFQMRRHFDDWQTVLNCALAAAEAAGDQRGRAATLFRMGEMLNDRADYEGARGCYRQAANLFADAADQHGYATVALYDAWLDHDDGHDDLALRRYQDAVPALRNAGDHGGEAFSLRRIGQLALERGSYADADRLFAEALAIYRRTGSQQGEAQVLVWTGMLRLQQHQHLAAERHFGAALDLARATGDRPGEGQSLRGLGLCFQRQGDPDKARSTLLEALRVVRQPRPTYLERLVLDALAGL